MSARFLWLLILLLFIGFILTGADYHRPYCNCVGYPELKLTSPPVSGPPVTELQERLARLKHYGGIVDGLYDVRVAKAVRGLQKDLGISITGNMDATTWAYLAWLEEGELAVFADQLPPPEGKVSLLVDIDALALVLYSDRDPYKIYPIAVGKWSTPTPMGEWLIIEKSAVWAGPFGARWMRLSCPWGAYGIHGTDNPSSIGWGASAGCIRMYNRDVIELYSWVPEGTVVKIISSRIYDVILPQRLHRGDVGQKVVPLQWKLKEMGFLSDRADGVFGEATEGAVQKLQLFYRLNPDGVADSLILYLLGLSGGGG